MKHPARYNQQILDELAVQVDKYDLKRILDPFGGVGGVYSLPTKRQISIECLEIEPEWASADPRITLGDATKMPWVDGYFDGIVTSPTYANRMADKTPGRRSYAAFLGRLLSKNNTGMHNWSGKQKIRYQELHKKAWIECRRVLTPSGMLILNFKDHYRAKKLEKVSDWHKNTLMELGFLLVDNIKVEASGFTRGRNRELRVDHENIYVFRKGL